MALRRGDVVEVRSAAEILSSLDARGALEALPFMAEMVPWCGKRLPVESTAERMCDTIEWTGSRRIPAAVLLGQVRCDGSGHDGCQGDCRFVWKEAWLRRVEPGAPVQSAAEGEEAARDALLALVARNTRQAPDGEQESKYRCQVTELHRASAPTSGFPYSVVLTSGDVTLGRYVRGLARALRWEVHRRTPWWSRKVFPGTATPVRRPPLDLQPGEWVRIRPAREVEETIDQKGGTRGLWFDREMLQFCGRNFRVKERISRFIHDDGTFVNFRSAAVKLELVTCSGDHSPGRYFCPRALYPYWREDWLERVPPPS